MERSIIHSTVPLGPMSSWVFQELSRRIITGELPPGGRVTEEFLAKSLDASRTPLREALNHLVDIGLIVRQRNRTVRIAPLELDEAIELSEIREHLEGIVARHAALRVRDERVPIDRLRDIAAQTEATLTSNYTASRDFDLGNQFHTELVVISGLKRTTKFLSQVKMGLARYRYLNASNRERVAARVSEHWSIYEAIERGDADDAERQMRDHIRNGLKSFHISLTKILAEAQSETGT